MPIIDLLVSTHSLVAMSLDPVALMTIAEPGSHRAAEPNVPCSARHSRIQLVTLHFFPQQPRVAARIAAEPAREVLTQGAASPSANAAMS